MSNLNCHVTSVANCGAPGSFLWRVNSNSAVNVEGYSDLPIEGRTIMFSCPPGLELAGPNSATCTDKRQWKLDFSMPTCIKVQGNWIACYYHDNLIELVDIAHVQLNIIMLGAHFMPITNIFLYYLAAIVVILATFVLEIVGTVNIYCACMKA